MHVPVLLKEVISALSLKKGDAVIDGTAGQGGHSREIRKIIGSSGNLLLIDLDPKNIKDLERETESFSNVQVAEGNYADLPDIMRRLNFPKAKALLLDLGFSSEQLKRGRGFSFSAAEPLIMTYSDKQKSLVEVLKNLTEKELTKIINDFGEEKYAKKIAEAVIRERDHLRTTADLAEVIKKTVPKYYERGRIHPATRTFQALRIYLNNELENLKKVLSELRLIVEPGGRVAIISFHSLEDRITKECFKALEKKGILSKVNKKPITASFSEKAENPRARSAKLRVATLIK